MEYLTWGWTVETLNEIVEAEVEALPEDMRARLARIAISRALNVTAVSRRVVIVWVFIKKTEKTPRREIALALSRAKLIRTREK